MKIIYLISLMLISFSALAENKFCDALKTIQDNESIIPSLNPARNLNKVPVYAKTREAYKIVFKETLNAARTDSLKYLVATVRQCRIDVKASAKTFKSKELKSHWSPEDYDKLLSKISQDKAFAESYIHKASWTVTMIGGACLLVAVLTTTEIAIIPVTGVGLAFAGEATSIATLIANRGPAFVKRLYLNKFDFDAQIEIDQLADKMAHDKMKELLNQ